MANHGFTTKLLVDQSPKEIFVAIINVRGWWTENAEGNSEKLNDEFKVRFGDVHYSKQRLIEVIPDRKVVWLVNESNLNFIKNKSEWTNTKISFEISKHGDKTQLVFTQIGLMPELECYKDCSNAWSDYINNSLQKLITTGKGLPALKNPKL